MLPRTMYRDRESMTKLLAIVGFGLITIGIFLLYNSPAEGYELSIYSATPVLVWVFLLTSLSIGLLIIIQQAFASQRDNFWLIGFFLAALAIFVILIIPPLRGYLSFGSGDSLVHIGIINDLMANAHLGEGNFYPITHILVAMISQIRGISSMWSSGYLLPFISVLFMVSTFLLAPISGLPA